MLERIDDFENIGQHVGFGALVDCDGEQGEIEVAATMVANDVCKESAAELVAAQKQSKDQ